MTMRVFSKLRVYIASSWRNEHYAAVLAALRTAGHAVFDWRESGFHFPDCTTRLDYVQALHSIDASAQFRRDMRAIEEADVVVLLLPAGASAHAEAAWAAAKDKQVIVYLGDEKPQPELMHCLFNGFAENIDQLLFVLSSAEAGDAHGDVTALEGVRLAP
jgi:nucleoside 2-deoxyribosyltransferase